MAAQGTAVVTPLKKGWVLAIRMYDGTDQNGGGDQWHWEYWTGEYGAGGGPSRTPWRGGAFHYPSALEAADHLNWHRHLFDLSEWRVIESKPKDDR